MSDNAGGAPARLSLIVAMAHNRVIGRDGRLPWRLPTDQQRFKALTMGHHIIMGRKTWESIGRSLPGRVSVVVTRNKAYGAAGATVVNSLAEALRVARADSEAFVIGGGELYREALPLAGRIYLTELKDEYLGDAFFPSLAEREWRAVQREQHPSRGAEPAWEFIVYERVRAAAELLQNKGPAARQAPA
jgi:dihydrofolate reductase